MSVTTRIASAVLWITWRVLCYCPGRFITVHTWRRDRQRMFFCVIQVSLLFMIVIIPTSDSQVKRSRSSPTPRRDKTTKLFRGDVLHYETWFVDGALQKTSVVVKCYSCYWLRRYGLGGGFFFAMDSFGICEASRTATHTATVHYVK